MKKKFVLFLSLFGLFLSACNPLPNENTESGGQGEGTENNSNTSNVVSRNQLGEGYYRPALDQEGSYQPSANRGITLNLNSGINIALFEKDLMRLSQSLFPTDEYFMREGQELSSDLISSWLGRESENNPEGLNPPESGNEEERAPRYLNSILEFDFYTQGEEGLNLSGISIGLAMNRVDYYQEEQFGPTLEQNIPPERVLEEGQRIGNEIVQRMRGIEGLEEIPIYIGIYEQAPQDDLGGGVYIAEGQSLNGATSVQSWSSLNEERLIFPLEGGNSAEGNAFANFQSEVESFFPNLSGITGRAHRVDEQLQNLTINIMTQFYGEAEIVAFTQYLKQTATTFLPADVDVEIIVESPDQVEAFLKRDNTETEYFSYVFD
jgi:protein involved in sex pheromone biosynthesis